MNESNDTIIVIKDITGWSVHRPVSPTTHHAKILYHHLTFIIWMRHLTAGVVRIGGWSLLGHQLREEKTGEHVYRFLHRLFGLHPSLIHPRSHVSTFISLK